MLRHCFTLFFALTAGFAFAQEQNAADVVVKQKLAPEEIDNYQSGLYYSSGGKVYTMRSYKMASGKDITALRVNPAGSDLSYIDAVGDKSKLSVIDLWNGKVIAANATASGYKPLAVCYSPNARWLYVLGSDERIHVLSTVSYDEKGSLTMPEAVTGKAAMAASANGYYLAVASGQKVYVLNIDDNAVRQILTTDAEIHDISFSTDSRMLALLTADGNCDVYDTRDFHVLHHYDAMGSATAMAFHPANKYIAVVTGDSRVAIINMLNPRDRHYVDAADGGVHFVRFLYGADGAAYLAYNTKSSFVFAPVAWLSPNRLEKLRNELNERMEVWMRQMDGESLEAYHARVNDETRMEQLKLFETEIATRMAEEQLSTSQIKIGSYNSDMSMLSLDFNNMPSIYLTVPKDQLGDFMDPGDLALENTKYYINPEDEFEMVYTEVVNKKTGKRYVFDNTERKSLAYLESDDNFVPFEQMQTSQMEELKLQGIRDNILQQARKKNVISNHTNIDVNTRVKSNVDANGKKQTDFEVQVSYTVDQAYSAKEDFPSGEYRLQKSPAAQAMLDVVREALEGDLARYVTAGKQVNITVTGMADVTPFSRTVAYDGSNGEYEREPVKKNNVLTNITVNKGTGISDNDQLAFLRAMGVKEYIIKNIPSLSNMRTSYDAEIDVSDKAGSQYRRIGVKFVFVNAF